MNGARFRGNLLPLTTLPGALARGSWRRPQRRMQFDHPLGLHRPRTTSGSPLRKTPDAVLVIEDRLPGGVPLARDVEASGVSEVCAACTREALVRLDAKRFGLILMAIDPAAASSTRDLALVRTKAPDAYLVMVTDTGGIALAVACMKGGADDVIQRPWAPATFERILTEAFGRDDQAAASSRGASSRDEAARLPLTSPRWEGAFGERMAFARARWGLSRRQAEVLATLAHGTSNKDIAQTLACSESTVELHVTALLRKSGAASRTELVARFWTLVL